MWASLFSRLGNLPLERLDPRLPAGSPAGDLGGDGRLDDHFRDHVSIYVGNGNVIHASNYSKYEKLVVTEMEYLKGFWGGKRFRLR